MFRRLTLFLWLMLSLAMCADYFPRIGTIQRTIGVNFGGTPTASQIIAYTCTFSISFPSGLTTPTSYASCGTNPGETDDYVIKVAGTQQADISLSTNCVATLTAASAFACVAGQRLEVDAPATVSGKDIAISLAGTSSS